MLNLTQLAGFGAGNSLPEPVLAFLAEDVPSSAAMGSWTNRGTGGATYDVTSGSGSVASGSSYGVNSYNGVRFDSSAEYLLMANELVIGSSESYSFALVCKLDTGSARLVGLGQHSSTGSGATMVAARATDGQIYLRDQGDSGGNSSGCPANAWTRIIVVKNGTGWTPYVDGVAQSAGSASFVASLRIQTIGYRNYSGGAQYSLGYVQEIRAYNAALDAIQVADLDAILKGKFAL